MLTEENLFDGTISTNTEHFYIEPSNKYSKELPKSGIHSIIYKLSDVKIDTHNHNDIDHADHCASEQLHRKIGRQRRTAENAKSNLFSRIKNVNEKSDFNVNHLKSNDDVISRKLSDNHDRFDVINQRSKRWLSNEEVSFNLRHIHFIITSCNKRRKFYILCLVEVFRECRLNRHIACISIFISMLQYCATLT